MFKNCLIIMSCLALSSQAAHLSGFAETNPNHPAVRDFILEVKALPLLPKPVSLTQMVGVCGSYGVAQGDGTVGFAAIPLNMNLQTDGTLYTVFGMYGSDNGPQKPVGPRVGFRTKYDCTTKKMIQFEAINFQVSQPSEATQDENPCAADIERIKSVALKQHCGDSPIRLFQTFLSEENKRGIGVGCMKHTLDVHPQTARLIARGDSANYFCHEETGKYEPAWGVGFAQADICPGE